MQRNVSTSPTEVATLAPAGSWRDAEWTSVQIPLNLSSRLHPLNPVPKLVIVAAPVTCTDSASEVATSVVDAATMVAEESAFVDRRIANPARM